VSSIVGDALVHEVDDFDLESFTGVAACV